MFAENLFYMRKMRKVTQEELAEKVGISRQTLSKYEKGESLPDIEVCARIANALDVTVDDLVNFEQSVLPMPPKGKYMFGTVTVGEKGEIILPTRARKVFDIRPGDGLIILGDENQGIGIIKENAFFEVANIIFAENNGEEKQKK